MKRTAIYLIPIAALCALGACASPSPDQAQAQPERTERLYTVGSNIPRGEHSTMNNTTDVSTDAVYGRPTAPKGQGG